MVEQTIISFLSSGMRCGLRRLAFAWMAVALLLMPAPGFAKSSPLKGDGTVDVDWLASEIKQLRENPPPNEVERRLLLEGCQQAQELLQEVASNAAEVKKTKAYLNEIPSRVEALQATPKQPPQAEETGTATLSLGKIEERVRAYETSLTVARRELNELETIRQDRTGHQIELARQIAESKSMLENLSKSPENTGGGESVAAEKLSRILKWARQASVEVKLLALSTELLCSRSSVELQALQIADAQRRSAQMARQFAQARELIQKLRDEGIHQAILRSEEKVRISSNIPGGTPRLKELAERNLELVRMESAADSLNRRNDYVGQRLETARIEQGTLRSDFERMRKRVAAIEAAGGRTDEALAQLLRERLDKLPPLTLSKNQSRSLRREVGDAMVKLDNYQDERLGLGEEDSIPAGWDIGSSPQALELGRELLQTQRTYLDALVVSYGSYLQTLAELQVAQKNISDLSMEFSNFIKERVLWIRSAPQWTLQNLGHRYVMFLRNWPVRGLQEIPRALASDLALHWFCAFLALGLFAAYLFFGPRVRARSRKLVEKAATHKCTAYLITLEECIYSGLWAARWPLCLGFIGWRLSVAEASVEESFIRCVGTSLLTTAKVFVCLQLFKQICRPKFGLGEAHLGWQAYNTQLICRHLTWLIPSVVPLVFVVNVVELQGFETTCGQSIFIVNMVLLGIYAHCLLRPKNGLRLLNSHEKLIPPNHPARVALYLVGIGVPVLLMGAAYLGYYFSAQEIAKRVLMSLVAAWFLYLASALIDRWFLIRQHRLMLHEAEHRREARKVEGDAHPATPPPVEMTSIDQQTTRLLRTLFGIALLLSTTYIWSETIPALKVLDSVKLWQVSYGVTDSKTAALPIMNGMTSAITIPRTAVGGDYVTLLNLLDGLLVLLVTMTASRNLPGLLKITFLSRIKLEQGVEHATVTMVRYAVVLVGMITFSNLLKLDWSKIQWIAAAFSLGIAFGLQELFANFISGLIILFERPIRLGDIISVGDITGTVTRINIRATRVTDADRRDFLVPNKNFITGNVLNWTLSDPVTRVTLPIGVAYGSDTEQVERLLCEAAAENPHILKKPESIAVLSEFGENTLNFKLFVYIPNRSIYQGMLHQLTTAIERKFREAGINIAFPQRDVHLSCEKPLEFKMVGGRDAIPGVPRHP